MPFGDIEPFTVPIKVTKGERPPIPKECSKEFSRLINNAWHQKASKRWSFDEIERKLKRMKMDLRAEAKRLYGKSADDEVSASYLPKDGKKVGSSDELEISDTQIKFTSSDPCNDEDSELSNNTISSGNSEKSTSTGNINLSQSIIERRATRKSSRGKSEIIVRKHQ